jgi:SWI/SNF-related matrix-associated actin-dependent regulator 1 of chromatin subfamily A
MKPNNEIIYDPERIEMSYATDSDLEIPSPEGLEYLPYQKAGIEFAVYNPFIHTLIGDEPGLGKTVQAIGVTNLRPGFPILIICPASLMMNWKVHFERWSMKKLSYQLINTGRDELSDVDCYIISFNLFSNKILFDKFSRKSFYYLIVDEAHKLKNPKAKRTKAVFGGGKVKGVLKKVRHVLALTGTPSPNRPIELYGIITALCPVALMKGDTLMSEETYGFKYCGGHYDSAGRPDFRGASNLKDLSNRLRSTFMIRRLKKNVLKDLPRKNVVITYLNSDPDCDRLVESMNQFDYKAIVGGNIPVSYEGLSEMRRELGEKIAPIAADYIREQLDGGHKKIVVFAHHKDCIDILEEELKEFGLVKIDGSTPKGSRQGLVDIFQADINTRIFLGSSAAHEGLTLTASSYVINVEPSWTPGNNDQAFDRIHRIGQDYSCLCEYLVLLNSLTEKILRSHLKKDGNIKTIMGD